MLAGISGGTVGLKTVIQLPVTQSPSTPGSISAALKGREASSGFTEALPFVLHQEMLPLIAQLLTQSCAEPACASLPPLSSREGEVFSFLPREVSLPLLNLIWLCGLAAEGFP